MPPAKLESSLATVHLKPRPARPAPAPAALLPVMRLSNEDPIFLGVEALHLFQRTLRS